MNEETETPEPLAAILAEMRDGIHTGRADIIDCVNDVLARYADRIEAAAERERSKYERLHECFWNVDSIQNIVRQMLDERDDLRDQNPKASESIGYFAQLLTKAAQSAPGNAAAMREALEGIEGDCRVLDRKDMWEEEGECYYEALRDIRDKVSAALAAPARNCDRFATAEEAVAAFADHLRAWENANGICSEYPDHPVQVPAGAFAWLFATAEGGAE